MANELKSIPRFEIRPLTEVEGGGYLVEFPDYPGCLADGATPEDALHEGIDALTSYCRTLEELGRPVPTSGEVYGGQWRQRVPKSLHAALARRAEREGVSLNTLAMTMLAEGLGRRRGWDEAGDSRQFKATVSSAGRSRGTRGA
jgi:antitoxin HicB